MGKNKELIIIGNGFDLFMGLESSYENFMLRVFDESENECKNRYKDNKIIPNILEKIKCLKNKDVKEFCKEFKKILERDIYYTNGFLFYMRNKKDLNIKNWCNVEEQIIEYYKFLNNEFFKDDLKKTMKLSISDILEKNEIEEIKEWLINNFDILIYILYENEKNINNFIKEDIERFENSFVRYINEINEYGIGILEEIKNKFENIFEIYEGNIKNKYIISFNYTTYLEKLYDNLKLFHIHGKAYSESYKGKLIPIFGIDKNIELFNEKLFKLTKTYKVMTRRTNEKIFLPKLNEIKKIVFFGHSLSRFDFSYFQSIFDYYSIYDSDVMLEFLYCIYNKKEKYNIEKNIYDSVYSLFEKYGEKLDNKDKGKNLLHKLLLEGRLKLIEIDDSGKRKID